MTSTTYVARTSTAVPARDDNTRTTSTMAYSHAVIGKTSGQAWSWHTSEALAHRALSSRGSATVRGTVVAVEAHQGGKATVLRRLAAEAPEELAQHGSAEPMDGPLDYVATETAAAAESVTRPARTWDASTATSHVCAGACAQELPATSYPTTGKPGQRGVVCRRDRDAARTAKATA